MGLDLSKSAIRTSLKASTWDGIFSTIFSSVAGGVLLSNCMLELQASTFEIGLLAAIPMLVNLAQPVGAHLAEQTTSRWRYGLLTFGLARSLWLLVAISLTGLFGLSATPQLILGVAVVSSLLCALGGASWFSWVAAIVPARLRGRYFGFRNMTVGVTTLLCLPLAGLAIDHWSGGSLQGYGVLLVLAVIAGIVSLLVQVYMVDVNPQAEQHQTASNDSPPVHPFREPNFRAFLSFQALWTFALNLSGPFFAVYLLDDLGLGLVWVTAYNSICAAANTLTLRFWGRVADRTGNRPLLIISGLCVAVTPFLWLGTSTDQWSMLLWLPLLHVLIGATTAALDLCTHNIQISIAPTTRNTSYFASVAAVGGVSGAIGAALGGYLGQSEFAGGLLGLFALSGVLRLVAVLPLFQVSENPAWTVPQVIQLLQLELRSLTGLLRGRPVQPTLLPSGTEVELIPSELMASELMPPELVPVEVESEPTPEQAATLPLRT